MNSSGQTQSQPGIILKKIPYQDADEIITVLLKDGSVHRFFVAGSRKSKKKYCGLIDHFAKLNFNYAPKTQGLWRLYDVEEVGIKQTHQDELAYFALANYFAELICEFTPEEVLAPELYALWMEWEGRIQTQKLTNYLIVYYLIRLLDYFGYAIELNRCVNCESQDFETKVLFDRVRGGIICRHCENSLTSFSIEVNRFDLSAITFLQQDFQATYDLHLEGEYFRFLEILMGFVESILQKKSKCGGFLLSILSFS